MCLQTVEWQGDPIYHNQYHFKQVGKNPLRIWQGWKIFYTDPYDYFFQYTGMFYGGPYKINHWYLAKTIYRIALEDYSLGFHAYASAEIANRAWENNMDKSCLAIVPVQLMGVKARGKDHYSHCLVADWMMIEGEE